jgi:hypothetical protein
VTGTIGTSTSGGALAVAGASLGGAAGGALVSLSEGAAVVPGVWLEPATPEPGREEDGAEDGPSPNPS